MQAPATSFIYTAQGELSHLHRTLPTTMQNQDNPCISGDSSFCQVTVDVNHYKGP